MWTTLGLASSKSSCKSQNHLFTGNRSYSCRAIKGSLSHTPTISHPLILWICDAWSSAILPHPTMATLSIVASLPACFEMTPQPLCCGHLWRPTQPCFQLLVAVIRLLPGGLPVLAVERRRQLPLCPAR